jgi:hypothetical protein
MKLEFLAEGSKECPLIRLYSFDQSAVLQLMNLISALAAGTTTNASLHEQPWIEPLGGCELKLCLGGRDEGVAQIGPSRFECVLRNEGWDDIAGLLKPFCESRRADVYQWLNDRGQISLLISASGDW